LIFDRCRDPGYTNLAPGADQGPPGPGPDLGTEEGTETGKKGLKGASGRRAQTGIIKSNTCFFKNLLNYICSSHFTTFFGGSFISKSTRFPFSKVSSLLELILLFIDQTFFF